MKPSDPFRPRSPLAPLAPVLRLPVEELWVDAPLAFGHALVVRVESILCDSDDVLPLVVVDEGKMLQGGDDILFLDASHLRHLTASTKHSRSYVSLYYGQLVSNDHLHWGRTTFTHLATERH